jgi:glycosyltransferase involved in cell wall biosynthesis
MISTDKSHSDARLAVVIPAYKVTAHIANVINGLGPEISEIFVVDDACPDRSGDYVRENVVDARVTVIKHEINQGVGGAMMTGYRAAMASKADIIVKVDGDGQMDPSLIVHFVAPILAGQADYTKGNRFYDLRALKRMPFVRLIGNATLSFLNKLSSGYWNLFDPTNGYTAIHVRVLRHLDLEKVSKGYFFESDMLFRLNLLRAVIADIPMDAKYADEVSNLRITREILRFMSGHLRNFSKRIFYNYFLRDFSIASLELVAGACMTVFGVTVGISAWAESIETGIPATAGTVMISTLPIILGFQLLLSFFSYDIASTPSRPIHQVLTD